MAGVVVTPLSYAAERPQIVSFKFSPAEIDTSTLKPEVNIELVVSHPIGIANTSVSVDISNQSNLSYGTILTRVDNPIQTNLQRVTFRGTFTAPANMVPGSYTLTAKRVKNSSLAGYQYESDDILVDDFRDFPGATNSLIVRSLGKLNLNYQTFVGPIYELGTTSVFKKPELLDSINLPIWRVNEVFDPAMYFEKQVKGLELKVESSTPSTCAVSENKLKLVSVGECRFEVFTPGNADYLRQTYFKVVQILSARKTVDLALTKIAPQNASNLPKNVVLTWVSNPSGGWVFPKSITPAVCQSVGYTAKIISGGKCVLEYRTDATETHLASPSFLQDFEITKTPQTITFNPSPTLELATKSLALTAAASSGNAILFSASPSEICTVSGSILNLLNIGQCLVTATQPGTVEISPVSASATITINGELQVVRMTLSCVKGKKTVTRTGTSPKCPKGYKLKK